MRIETAATTPSIVRAGGLRDFIVQAVLGRWGIMPNFEIRGEINAVVNASRWIVKCPYCDGSMFADLADPINFCVDCCNQGNGGGPGVPGYSFRVIFPPDPQLKEIEASLLARPDPRTRNWYPHETSGDLLRENIAHGIR